MLKLGPTLKSLLLLPFIFAATANADVKVVTVDINKILNESAEGQAVRTKLDAKAQDIRKKIEAKKAVLIEMQKKLKDGSENSPAADKFKSAARDFERFVHDNDEDMKQDFLKANGALTTKVLKSIEAYAKDKKIDLVLQKGEKGGSAVLYGTGDGDITEEILSRFKK